MPANLSLTRRSAKARQRGTRHTAGVLRRAVAQAALALAWTLIAALTAFSVIRVVQPWGSPLMVAAIGLTPWLYLAAWPVVVLASLVRRWMMAVAAALLVVVQVLFVLPSMHPWATARPASSRWRLTAFDANVRYSNTDLTGIASEIHADNPDIVTLEELSTGNVASLASTHVLDRYAWHFVHLSGGSAGFGVWSRVPMADIRLWSVPGHPEVEATVQPPGQESIHLLVIHTLAPVGRVQLGLWNEELQQIAQRVRQEARPLIVIGDFNATSDMRQFQAVDRSLDDAAVERGAGWQMTWPRDRRVVPPFLRIDHALYSSQLTATSYRLGNGAGSDHRPLMVTFAWSK